MGNSTTVYRRQPKSFAKLIIQANGDERTVELRERTTSLGRSHENSIEIDDINSSRKHCVIEKGTNGYDIVDLKSRNGTLVNGVPVERNPLQPGDRIRVGDVEMVFER